jgi:NitT/TauT family transport system ATP-binding protein
MTKPAPRRKPKEELESLPAGKICIEKVSKTYTTERGSVTALAEVDLEIGEAEFVCLLGPSGCGKSTLLYMIAGLERPDTGRVLCDGSEITGPGRDRMVMFQEHALFAWRNVIGNVMFGLELKEGLDRNSRREVARYYLQLVGLLEKERHHVHELSGGQRQRVALARSLAPNPRVLLMDEPFASLDALTREQLYTDLQKIWKARHKTIVFVTHNVREAVCLGDRVIVFAPSPGRPVAEFPISLPRPRDPNSKEVAEQAAQILDTLKDEAVLAADRAEVRL